MSTDVIKQDGTGDWTSVDDWLAGIPITLVDNEVGTIGDSGAYTDVATNPEVFPITFAGHTLGSYTIKLDATTGHGGVHGVGPTVKNTSGTADVFQIDEDCTFDNFTIELANTGVSAEAVSIDTDGVTWTGDRLYIHSENLTAEQDGVYVGQRDLVTVNLYRSIVKNFDRCGLHLQMYGNAGAKSCTANVRHCAFVDNGKGTDAGAGGVGAYANDADFDINMNVYNTWSLNNTSGSTAADYNERSGSGVVNWIGTNNISSDTSCTGRFGAGGGTNLDSRTLTATTQATGDYVIVKDMAGPAYDWKLLDDSGGNDAYHAGTSTQSFAEDINGDAFDSTTPSVGPDEYIAASGGAALTTSVNATATTAADLTTSITLAAAANAQATTAADLTTGIAMASAVTAQATTAADLTTSIDLVVNATAQATTAADLSTQIPLASSVSAAATTTADLTVGDTTALASSVTAQATATADLTTGIAMASSATAQATTAAALTTGISLVGNVTAQATVAADLSTGISLGSSVVAQCGTVAEMTTGISLVSSVTAQATTLADLFTGSGVGTVTNPRIDILTARRRMSSLTPQRRIRLQ